MSSQNHGVDGLALPLVLGEAIDSYARPQISSIWDSVPNINPGSRRYVDQEKTAALASFVHPSSFQPIHYSYGNDPYNASSSRISNNCAVPSDNAGKTAAQLAQLTGSYSLPIEWMITDSSRGLNCNSPGGSSRFSNEYSTSVVKSAREPCSENSSSSGSIFLQAMQEILVEIAFYALENAGIDENGTNFCLSSSRPARTPLDADADKAIVSQDIHHIEARKRHLLALLQSVDDKYNQCLHEIHTVSSAFHAVTELDPNLHARFALPAISSMYKNLRERISSHILPLGIEGQQCIIEKQRQQQPWDHHHQQQLSKRDRDRDRDRDCHQLLWKPQRGLPERSVSVLRAWMFQNFLHPYPKDADKHLLALKSGLTRNQVSNWFINARVRLWKPMIEEMYAELNINRSRKPPRI
ncbi:homeobox protein ATH1-like isoform X2 [Andrographis paniculata]|nr:homeobox protein ATH1-like isoform X2 [Andrographis paniculata]